MSGKVVINKKSGTGMGSVLLNSGGPGSGSSYASMDDYLHTSKGGRIRPAPVGVGLGGQIEAKLQSLQLRPEPKDYRKKPSNISFSI
jgi:hypothetical protein